MLPICHLEFRGEKPKPRDYPTNPKSLGGHLKKRRLDLGLIQREVALKIGADEASVWLWENDQAQPSLRFRPAVLAFMGYDPQSAPTSLGERLIRFRELRGWSQKRLAETLIVDPTTLSRWELGKKKPWGDYLKRINALIKET